MITSLQKEGRRSPKTSHCCLTSHFSEFKLSLGLKREDEKAPTSLGFPAKDFRFTYALALRGGFGTFKSEEDIGVTALKLENIESDVHPKLEGYAGGRNVPFEPEQASGDMKWRIQTQNSEESKMTTPAVAGIREVGSVLATTFSMTLITIRVISTSRRLLHSQRGGHRLLARMRKLKF